MEALDFEARRAYELVVRATDNGRPRALSASALVRVLVEDANDEPPVIELVDLSSSPGAGHPADLPITHRSAFGRSGRGGGGGGGALWSHDARRLDIYENEPPGTWLAGVLVTDADAEAPQSLHCRLDARLSPLAFDLRPIDQKQSQTQTILTTSGGGKTQQQQASLRADRRPPFAKRSVDGERKQRQQLESPHQRRRLYALVTNASFDRERDSLFADTIRCSDRGDPPLESALAFSVQVRDRNDNAPRFREPLLHVRVRENNAPDEAIGQLHTFDADDVDAAGESQADANEAQAQAHVRTHYFLEPVPEQLNTSAAVALLLDDNPSHNLSGAAAGAAGGAEGRWDVRVERDTGRLVAAVPLDRERRPAYRFFAVARDAAAPALSSRALLVVEVLDENDNSVQIGQIH